MPDAPIGLEESTPPEAFQGMSPSKAVAPDSVSFHPSPRSQNPEVLQPHGLVPAERHVDLGAVELGPGVGDPRLGVHVGRAVPSGLRVDLVPTGEHGGLGAHGRPVDPRRRVRHPRATSSAASTMAAAPSEDGQASRYRSGIPQHHRVLDHLHVDVGQVQVGVRVPHGVLAVLDRHHPPDVVGGSRPAHVGPDVRGEVAAGPGQQRGGEGLGHRQRPHGVRVRLLFVGDGQHPLVDARLAPGGRPRWRSTRRRSRRCGPGTSACPPPRGRAPGRSPASCCPRTCRGPCRSPRRRCPTSPGRRRPGPSWPPRVPDRRWTRRPAWPCGGSGPLR